MQHYTLNSAGSNCPYRYGTQPRSQACSCGSSPSLSCTMNYHSDKPVDLRWYWNVSEKSAGVDINETSITGEQNKYKLSKQFVIEYTNSYPPLSGRLQYHSTTSTLTIQDFCGNEEGYYWCQAVFEDTFLEPSHVALVAMKSETFPPLPECTSEETSDPPPKCANMIFIAVSSTQSSNEPSHTCTVGRLSCYTAYSVFGVVALVVLLLCLVIIFITAFCFVRKWRQRKRKGI